MKFYTGIGSRTPPQTIYTLMVEYGIRLGNLKYILRSGAADGCDTAFENASLFVPEPMGNEIYIPWKGFNKESNQRKYLKLSELYLKNIPQNIVEQAREISAKCHPRWQYLSYGVKCIHTRNVFQVLGQDLKTPSEFLICWTASGGLMGGTAQAMRVALEYKVPIYNLYNLVDKLALDNLIKMKENEQRGIK